MAGESMSSWDHGIACIIACDQSLIPGTQCAGPWCDMAAIAVVCVRDKNRLDFTLVICG